ncbi:MAG: hypothetical protein ACXVCL_14825 [Bdellovibrio sp.]
MHFKKIKIFAFIFLILFVSCKAKEEPVTREKLLSKGFSLIDEKQYDQAIKYFEDLHQVDPHYHVKIAWASAYAARAGVRLEQIYSFTAIKNISFNSPLEASIYNLVDDKKIKEILMIIAKYLEHWNKVPILSGENLSDIFSAIKILETTEQSGARLYCAVLRVIFIKSSVIEVLKNWNPSCSYKEAARAILEQLLFLCQDLQLSFPENKEQYESFAKFIEKILHDISEMKFLKADQCH